jgi:hypothetical protein
MLQEVHCATGSPSLLVLLRHGRTQPTSSYLAMAAQLQLAAMAALLQPSAMQVLLRPSAMPAAVVVALLKVRIDHRVTWGPSPLLS